MIATKRARRKPLRGLACALAAIGAGALPLASSPPAAAGTTPSISQTWQVTEPDTGGPIAESSPNVADLPGGPAVVVGDRSGHVYALDLATGTTVSGWPYETGGIPVDSTPSVWSPTGGLDDVFVGVGNAATPESGGYVGISPQGTGLWSTTIRRVPSLTTDAGVQASMAIGTLEGQTATVAGSLGQEADALNAQTGAVLGGYPWFEADSTFSSPAIADLYGNGQHEIVEGGDSTAGIAYGVTYQNGGHIRVLSQTGNAGTGNPSGGLICEYNTNQTVQSSPAVGRFLANGTAMGIVAGTSDYYPGASQTDDLIALNSSCAPVWTDKLDGTTSSSPALADVEGDGQLQVVEGTNNGAGGGSVWVLDGSTGQTLWRATTTGEVIGGVVTADLAGQGYQDPIVPTTNGVDIFDGRSGALVDWLEQGIGFQNSPLVTEDPNGTIGITVAGYNGYNQGVVTHFEAPSTDQTGVDGPGAWPMFHHDPQLTGTSTFSDPPPLASPNLVTDPAFQSGMGAWQANPGQNYAIYASSSAPVDGSYLETNSGSSSSPSLYEDTASAPVAGHSYQASMFLRSPSSTPINVAMVLWALGGTTEGAQSDFTVSSSTWTQFSTDLDVANPDHSDLRLQLFWSGSANLDVDGVTLRDAGVGDAGFARGLGPWGVSAGQNWATYPTSTSPVGSDYLETNAGSSSSPSLYQDIPVTAGPGHTYQAAVELRSPSSSPIDVTMVLWALGGTTEAAQSDFTVSSSTWTQYTTDLDVANPGHSDLRLQLFWSGSANLDVGSAAFCDTGAADATFDQAGLGPWNVSAGANWADGSGSGPTGSGQSWLDTNTGSGTSSSLYQDIAAGLQPDHPYTVTMDLRSFGSPIAVAVVLWALGGSGPAEVAQTDATVGSSWQTVSTELDVAGAGHDDLRVQIYVGTSGATLGVSQVSVPDAADD